MTTIPKSRQVARAFGRRAASYDQNASVQRKLIDLVVDDCIAGTDSAGLLIDLGCGTGLLKQAFLERNIERLVIGIDIAREPLLHLHQKNLDMPTVQADMRHIPFRSKCVDGVSLTSSLQWVVDPANVVHQIAEILNYSGHCIFSFFIKGAFSELFEMRDRFSLEQPVALLSESSLNDIFIREGFIFKSSSIFECTEYFPDALTLLRKLNLIGATAMSGRRLSRRELHDFCTAYQDRFRTNQGVPLTYRALYGCAILTEKS